MNKRLYVDFHILQTVPPSCINRDDTGSPKTAVYGGVLRARVSSQAWKHAMRAAFAENAQLDVGKRTKKAAELVKAQILALAPELDADKLAKKALENAGIKSDDKGTKALFFMSTAQAKALAELAVEGSADKKQYRDALKAAPSMDMALFGRMVADDPSLNYDAAAQVAHSISTHAVQNEYDYFTAVDDCQAEDNAGASHLGTVEYNSSTLYRYATVNVMELAGQLGAAQAAETVRAFGEAFLFTIIDKSTKRIGTVGINPSDFPFNFYLFICCPDDRYQCVHHLPLVLKADILPVIQIPGNAFHLLHRHSVRREFCNLIGNGLPPCVQFLNFAVGIGEQNRACARQRVKQLFNLAFYLCQFQPLCSQFRGDFCSLVPTCQRLKIFQLFNHRPIDYRFQFVQLHAPAARTRLAVRMDGAAQVKNTVGVRRHERIAAFPAFDFSRHPCVPGFPCGLVGVAGKQLLPAFQPQLRWDKPLMWSQYQRLSLQVLVLVLCIPLALIVIAAICPGKVGGIIVNIRPLAFVKLVYVEVSHDINRVSENNAQSSP